MLIARAFLFIGCAGALLAADTDSSITTAVVGLEQAGGSSANGDQKLFIDIFHSYPLPLQLSWWGDVLIASYPQQVNTTVGQAAADLANQFNKTPVNQLAQFGEFRTGLERRLASSPSHKTSLGFIAYIGSLGSLTSPTQTAQVFQMPPDGTPQQAAFNAAFPVSKYPTLGLPATQYVAFTTPVRDRFYLQYGAGFRLTAHSSDSNGNTLPGVAMISAAFGQNEFVTGGLLRGMVGTFEAFYPLPLGSSTKVSAVFYLFGRTTLRLGGASSSSTPLALTPAPQVPVTSPNVAVIALPSNRDLYAIGIAIDAAQLISNFRAPPVHQ
jgi:hypothetical protein